MAASWPPKDPTDRNCPSIRDSYSLTSPRRSWSLVLGRWLLVMSLGRSSLGRWAPATNDQRQRPMTNNQRQTTNDYKLYPCAFLSLFRSFEHAPALSAR